MKTGTNAGRAAAALLALLLALGTLASAAAETPAAPAAMDIDLLMAQNAVAGFGIRGKDGHLLVPRRAPEMNGRGEPDSPGAEPDYRGVVGYMSLQSSWEVSRFNTFTRTPWQLPVYERNGGEWAVTDSIKHKTPVLVVDQEIREGIGHKFMGYLQVIRLDIHRMVWVDVAQFVTVPYWTFGLQDAIRYGYCIAVYRDTSRCEPMDRKKHRGSLPDGLRILMCDRKTSRYFSPSRATNPLLGIVFRGREAKDAWSRTFLFFNQEDLTLIY